MGRQVEANKREGNGETERETEIKRQEDRQDGTKGHSEDPPRCCEPGLDLLPPQSWWDPLPSPVAYP